MSESTCLHIQGRESGPIRVVELPWISVRIGRAPYCEVRLSEHDLAEEACRLQKRGRSWYLVPVASRSPASLDGRPIEGSCLLPFDVPFCIGHYCLTLRRDRAAEPDWEMYHAPSPPQIEHSSPLSDTGLAALADRPVSIMGELRSANAEARPAPVAVRTEPRKEQPTTPSVKDRWDARWRAVGAELKARSNRTRTAQELGRPDYGTGFNAVPLKERRVHPAPAPVPARIDRHVQSIQPTPLASRTDSDRACPDVKAPERVLLPQFSWSDWIGREKLADFRRWDEVEPKTNADCPRPGQANFLAEDPQALADPEPVVDPLNDANSLIVEPNRAQEPAGEEPEDEGTSAIASEVGPDTTSEFEQIGSFSSWEEHHDSRSPAEKDLETFFESSDAIMPSPTANGTDHALPTREKEAESYAPVLEMRSILSRDRDEADESFKVSSQIDTTEVERNGFGRPENISRLGVADEHGPREKRPEARKEKLTGSGLDPVAGRQLRDRTRMQSPGGRPRRDTQPKRIAPARAPADADPSLREPGSSDSIRSGNSVEWPSAQEILATYRARPIPSGSARMTNKPGKRTLNQATPTSACEPSHWTIPIWVAWPPLAVLVVGVGVIGCFLSCSWASDSYSAALMTDRLMDVSTRRNSLPDSVSPPTGSWTRTTAQHLAHWAIYLERSESARETSAPDIRGLVTTALQVSPINATARLVQAQLERAADNGKTSIHVLGLSRDPFSLAWTARQLFADGKKEAALNVYCQALDVASRTEFSKISPPRFNSDPDVPRFLLPGEERIRDIIGELVTNHDWTVDDWLKVVPKRTFVPLAMARSLREQGRKEVADALLDVILNDSRGASTDRSIESLRLASRAEALALRSRWQEADQIYREAIEMLDDATVKRSWWFNLADIAFRLADDTKWQSALQATLTAANSDEISRRASEILRTAYTRPGLRSNGTKAN